MRLIAFPVLLAFATVATAQTEPVTPPPADAPAQSQPSTATPAADTTASRIAADQAELPIPTPQTPITPAPQQAATGQVAQPTLGPANDGRIQTLTYLPDRVVQLPVAPGYQLTVEVAPGERIENIAIGDGSAWQVTPNKRGDHFFVKQTGAGSSTNLTVVTDARTYTFELVPLSSLQPDSPYTVRLASPEGDGDAAADPGGEAVVPLPPGRYRLSGSREIRPDAMSDDGVHTYISWTPAQTLPAVFTIDRAGHETLVNGAMRGGLFVIDAIANRVVFRLDRLTAYGDRRVIKERRR